MATPKDSAPNEERITAKATSPVHTAVKVPLPITIVDVTSDDVPPFSLETERYDQSTYYGRFRKMLDVVDPRTLLCSQKEIDDAVKLLKRFPRFAVCVVHGHVTGICIILVLHVCS